MAASSNRKSCRLNLKISDELLEQTVRFLTNQNAELQEEVHQLQAAVNIYRELAARGGQPICSSTSADHCSR